MKITLFYTLRSCPVFGEHYTQGKYDEAITNFQKAIELAPKYFGAKYSLAEIHLIMGRFDTALALADEMLTEKNVPIQHVLSMRFLLISSLLFQGKRAEALDETKEFIAYYKSLPEKYRKHWKYWKYDRSKNFINNTDKLPESNKALLLTLIDILGSPKPEADRKLEELEASLAERFTE